MLLKMSTNIKRAALILPDERHSAFGGNYLSGEVYPFHYPHIYTGALFFTTDTAAALRGLEMNVDIVIKATKVDGVYTDDPQTHPDAMRYQRISFDEAIVKKLKVMDATALTLCRDQKLPICVFSIFKAGALRRVVMGEDEGTLVYV